MVGKTTPAIAPEAKEKTVGEMNNVELGAHGLKLANAGEFDRASDIYRLLCGRITAEVAKVPELAEMLKARTAIGKIVNSPANKEAKLTSKMAKIEAQLAEIRAKK